MLKRFFLLPLTIAGLFSLVLFVAGCDGPLAISGTVYEWVDPPPTAHSQVYIDQTIPGNIQLSPIENANVTIFFKSTFDKGNTSYIVMHARTDANGNFQQSGISDPSRKTYVVTVDEESYVEGLAEFISPSNKKYVSPTDNNYTHIIRAVLVKK